MMHSGQVLPVCENRLTKVLVLGKATRDDIIVIRLLSMESDTRE